ncbi:FAD-dependent oxidoreductase [Streptomyces rubrogriseus]|uniref:FAD-dependent oxidoreductase n=1 Tax=Streptomyces rubrogriseus TaxID=194673 RepID=UPI0037CD2ED4
MTAESGTTERCSVVIVGGGTCGLAAACELLQLGVSVRLLESQPEAAKGSRAILLWPLGLAVLRHLGLYEEAVRRGLPLRSLVYHLDGGRRLRSEIGAENEALLLPQEQTSRLLEERLTELGGRVERSARVTDVVADDRGVTVKTQGPDGGELVEADWLIGADGLGSTVRERLGVEFPGTTLPTTYLAAEGRVDGEAERGAVHYFLRSTGPMVFAPLRDGVTRLGTPVGPDTPLVAETVQRLLDERGPGGLRVRELDTLDTFGSQERIATELRKGRCFLVGDAAHTHSPIGGQGLNLGLQDVHNLAWKLAGVISGTFDAAILDSYDSERRQAAEQILVNTGRFTRMFTLGPAAARVRNAAWRLLETTGVLRRRLVPLLAGWRVRYEGGGLTSEPERTGRGLRARGLRQPPLPGSRTPSWVPPAGAGADPLAFRMVTTGPVGGALAVAARSVAAAFPRQVRHEHLSRPGAAFLLLRPDGFVAASGTTPEGARRAGTLLTDLVTRPT